MSVKLRGHHLLCILTFVGHGYSRAFSDNYKAVVQRLNAGEPVVLVDGPDDICAALIKEDAIRIASRAVLPSVILLRLRSLMPCWSVPLGSVRNWCYLLI